MNIQEKETIIRYYQNIDGKKNWLLFHSKKFLSELDKILKETNTELPAVNPLHQVFSLQILEILDFHNDPKWQKFFNRWKIGNCWNFKKIFEKIGTHPLGIEVVGDNKPEAVRFIIWPGQTNLEDIKSVWKELNEIIQPEIELDSALWLKKGENFWRDVRWYEMRIEKGLSVSEIANKEYEIDPIIAEKAFTHYLIRKRNEHPWTKNLLSIFDPGLKITNSKMYKNEDKINRLCYNCGIYKIGIPRETREVKNYFLVYKFPSVDDNNRFIFLKDKEYYVYYNYWDNNDWLFDKKNDDDELKKMAIRDEFINEMEMEYLYNKDLSIGFSHFEATINSAINRIKKLIKEINKVYTK